MTTPELDKETCVTCGKPLPPNWGMCFCNAACAKRYNDGRRQGALASPYTLPEHVPLPPYGMLQGYYMAGCVLAVPVKTEVGVVSHKGIMGDRVGKDGLPTVLHNAKFFGCIVETSMSVYALQSMGAISSDGFPGRLSPAAVLERARSQIEQPWRPWFNCEHFTAWAHDVAVKSPQLRQAAKKGAGAVGAAIGMLTIARLVG